jgi:nitroimidazol reductase NimA-like FMN-containing flavoprotein (pyridoxamine 5'-phosphate oxidase superfamily)
MTGTPRFREMSHAECEALLERNHVGRVAYAFHDRVDIRPVHYVYADGWLHGRTGGGEKILTVRHSPWIAFEVDEVNGVFDWQSVVVHGTMHLPDSEGSATDQHAFVQTLEAIRTIVPEALDQDDPTPERLLLFRVHVDEMTGRIASTSSRAHLPSSR